MNTILAILEALVNSLWQAAIVAGLVWLALRFLPRVVVGFKAIELNAATRYAIWWAALAVVLVLPVAPSALRAMRPRPLAAALKAPASPKLAPAPLPTAEPVIITVAPDRAARWPLAIVAVWAAILLFRLGQITRSYFYLRGVKRRAAVSPIPLPASGRRADLLISPDILSPMAVGFVRPAVILPESLLGELSDPEREHVLLHEMAHLAGYDDWSNLAMRLLGAALALHPIAIWILHRIEREREMVCDDWVVARTSEARPYAATLARLFELRWSRHNEALAPGLFGRGTRVGDRIEMLLRRGRTFSPRASGSGVAASALILGALLLAGSLTPRWIAFAEEQTRPSFEVVSVKPDVSGADGTYFRFFGETVTLKNQTLKDILANAWQVKDFQILGGAGWIDSARYDIEAKAPGNPGLDRKRLMLQSLLADRFKLTFHRELKELPVYELTVAKSGLKLPQPNCVAFDSANPTPPPPGRKLMDYCGSAGFGQGRFDASAESMPELAGSLSFLLGRTVVDKTGIAGTFRVQITFSPEDPMIRLPDVPHDPGNPPAAAEDSPSVFEAVQEQLGLKLQSGKGLVEVLVIDRAAKPDAN